MHLASAGGGGGGGLAGTEEGGATGLTLTLTLILSRRSTGSRFRRCSVVGSAGSAGVLVASTRAAQ